ncbi:hypothetical protein GJ744_007253 [Endocarpon pusillum]|uniref:Hemolysin-III channel protein Izh2 n=1 Tax=Endocarpon pusillum TaxID=364733 RepID=A0A8H7AKQ9_9EURO|nr:hypothetical protein GJ744_007253 [Endocarpon pusillum]
MEKDKSASLDKDDTNERSENWYSLVQWDEVPHWQQDNHHIHGSYRRPSGSYPRSLRSLFYIHNETVNIYTHLLPTLAAPPTALALYKILQPRYVQATTRDVLAFSCFFLGAAICLAMSATYHLISNHSPAVNKFGNQLDYVGIVLLITGSFVPSIYYGFWCDTTLQRLYWTMICSLGAGCTSISVMSRFRTPTWRPFRAGMFVLMGLSAVFPVLHGLRLYGASQMKKQIGLSWLVLQGGLYILGAAIYAARVPEKWSPGRYDILGNSHQIFHVLVVLAAVSHLTGLLKAFDYRHGLPGGICF